MMNEMKIGAVGRAETVVNEYNTAKAMKSGALDVFATPCMCALMEEAACNAVRDYLDEGMGTVGISLNITHDKPSAPGSKIVATATLTAVEGRKLVFDVQAQENDKIIGKGTHERFIIDNAKFMAKLQK
ncbi:thioesterase family protein [Megamonas hypermegale]|uniref:thioesterase family protein n=1 Tax=Megamonas hypermegale TaxID=158847 RepID=UPI00320B2232